MTRGAAFFIYAIGTILGIAIGWCWRVNVERQSEHDATVALALCAQQAHHHWLVWHPDADGVAVSWWEVEMAARAREGR